MDRPSPPSSQKPTHRLAANRRRSPNLASCSSAHQTCYHDLSGYIGLTGDSSTARGEVHEAGHVLGAIAAWPPSERQQSHQIWVVAIPTSATPTERHTALVPG